MNPAHYTGLDWVRQHKMGVMSILGAETPLVLSQGSQFYNADRWTGRYLVHQMCVWAKENPGSCATSQDVANWVRLANSGERPIRKIVIAATPAKISLRVALALVGGGYHEAWHTRYSCRRQIAVHEAEAFILPRWAQVENWGLYESMLQTWNNIIEDIRIERRGNEQYPGCYQKMCELQDFILSQENAANAKVMGTPDQDKATSTIQIVSAIFRDLGLGYETGDQNAALAFYRAHNPDACAMVEDGPLLPILEAAINLDSSDDLGCIRLAMDVIALLASLVDPKDMEQAQQQAQSSGKTACPKCQAPANCLVARPLSDGKGGRVAGKLVITCTKCGWQEIVDAKPSSGSSSSGESIRYEDVPQEPDSQGEGSEGEGSEGEGSEGEGSEGEGSEGEGSEGEGSEGEGSEGEGSEGEGSGEPKNGKGKGEGKETSENSEGPPASGAGGHFHDTNSVTPWELVAAEILAGDPVQLKDLGDALREAIEEIWHQETQDCQSEEAVWKPWSPSIDEVLLVKESKAGRADDDSRASKILDSVRAEASYLRARLRSIIRAVEQRSITHGVRRGKDLSERMLVDSVASLQAGKIPSRAYYNISDKVDTSIAAAIVLDESGSMSGRLLQDATRAMMAITEPIDAIGGAVLALGFRDGASPDGIPSRNTEGYHRYEGIIYDIFKNFDERFMSARWRFANTRGCGGTPMADGIQYAMTALQSRPEKHKILWVLTDGEPNWGHRPVINRQIRLAAKHNIHIVGVGIGAAASSVKTTFKQDHIWVEKMEEMPILLIDKLNTLLDFRKNIRRSGD